MLARIRPDLARDSATFRAAVLLIAGPALGFNVDRLAARASVPRAMAAAFTRRWFDNGVWQPAGPVYPWSSPAEPEFWSDVAVGEGKLCRRGDRIETIEWAAPGKWRKSYDFVSKPDGPLNVAYADEQTQSSRKEVPEETLSEPLDVTVESKSEPVEEAPLSAIDDEWDEAEEEITAAAEEQIVAAPEEEIAAAPVISPAVDQTTWIGGQPVDPPASAPLTNHNVWIGGYPGSSWLI